MAYYLQVKDFNGEYRSLNLNKSDKFNSDVISSSFVKSTAYSLQGLDHFTMKFENETELKNHLLLSGILPINLANRPLFIRFKNKINARNYDLLFKDDLEFFYVPDSLINFVEVRYQNKDFKFIRDLAEYFRNFRECGTTASELIALSDKAINSSQIDRGFNERDVNGDNPIRRLVKLLIYKYKTLPGNNIEYNYNEFNWRTLHILIEFIKDYEQKELKPIIEEKIESKKKIRKKEDNPTDRELSGQISIMDYLDY